MQPQTRKQGYLLRVAGRLVFCKSQRRSATSPSAIDPRTVFSMKSRSSFVHLSPFVWVAWNRILSFLVFSWPGPNQQCKHNKGLTTYVADTLGRSARKESEGSWEGRPSARCSDRPCHHPGHRTDRAPGHRQVGIQSEAAEAGHHRGKREVERPGDPQDWGRRPGWLGQPERQRRAHAPQRPCAELLPPSYEPSTPCEFP